MITDHTAAGKKLDQISAEAGVTPAENGVGQKTEYTDELEELQKAADFDAEYIDQQVTAHEDAVNLFESYGQDGEDAKLKAFAAETLPTLKGHHGYACAMRQFRSSKAQPGRQNWAKTPAPRTSNYHLDEHQKKEPLSTCIGG